MTDFIGKWTATEYHNSYKGGDPDPYDDERDIEITKNKIEFPRNGGDFDLDELEYGDSSNIVFI